MNIAFTMQMTFIYSDERKRQQQMKNGRSWNANDDEDKGERRPAPRLDL